MVALALACFGLLALFGLLAAALFSVWGRLRQLEAEVRALRAVAAQADTSSVGPGHALGAAPAAAPPPAGGREEPATRAAPPAAAPSPAPRAPEPVRVRDAERIEQMIGGVWLQNLGAVLLLLGVFLMILWGYTTQRLGPRVLVGAGVLFGITLAWRGDRVARRVAPFGHALIGLGIGIVYVTLHLGYVRLHVLPAPLAFALLLLVSFVSIAAGLRYRVQLIAALGVIGAFLPQYMAAWLHLEGFHLAPWPLLAYLALVDALVFALTARAGWSSLDLTALVLSALAWIAVQGGSLWGWGEQVALAALFTLLGLAPLPRLAAVEGRVRPVDLAVVVVAPVCMLVASAPFLQYAGRESVATLLFTLALVMLVAALWVDTRRPERDLWAALTAAASVLLAAALERALGPQSTPTAWAVEGVALIALGLRPRGGWLRLWGSFVLLAGSLWSLVGLASSHWHVGAWPVFYPDGLRHLACTAAVLLVAGLLARERDRLGRIERHVPEDWGALGNLLLLGWFAVESGHVASAVFDPGGGVHRLPPPAGIPLALRRGAFESALCGAAWTAQAAVLAWLGSAARRPFLRACAYVIGAVTLLAALPAAGADGWWLDQRPALHAVALLRLLSIGFAFAVAWRLAERRDVLTASDRRVPEVWTAVAGVMLAAWSAHESGHAARAMLNEPGVPGEALSARAALQTGTLGSALSSGAWLAEAVGFLVIGWSRGSAFLRWCCLVLLGATLLKFIVVDLRSVDVFWRFLTAIVVGAAMLGMSWVYQRRSRAGAGPPGGVARASADEGGARHDG